MFSTVITVLAIARQGATTKEAYRAYLEVRCLICGREKTRPGTANSPPPPAENERRSLCTARVRCSSFSRLCRRRRQVVSLCAEFYTGFVTKLSAAMHCRADWVRRGPDLKGTL